jgi:hypothetical protein
MTAGPKLGGNAEQEFHVLLHNNQWRKTWPAPRNIPTTN